MECDIFNIGLVSDQSWNIEALIKLFPSYLQPSYPRVQQSGGIKGELSLHQVARWCLPGKMRIFFSLRFFLHYFFSARNFDISAQDRNHRVSDQSTLRNFYPPNTQKVGEIFKLDNFTRYLFKTIKFYCNQEKVKGTSNESLSMKHSLFTNQL